VTANSNREIVGFQLCTQSESTNTAMQSLLAKLGYVISGAIHNLDEDDPELVYMKRLNEKAVQLRLYVLAVRCWIAVCPSKSHPA
jgi:hypothetical protein